VGALVKRYSLAILLASLPLWAYAENASLYLRPAQGVFVVGGTLDVGVYLNTGGNSVNAVRVDLTFPPDKMQVVSPSIGKSLVSFWVVQPTFSNSNGTISFQGGVPAPGINTTDGLISNITLRITNIGPAALSIGDSSQVLLADGKGTNILGSRSNAIFSFLLPPPLGPVVVAPRHQDPNKWYQDNNVEFVWEMPRGATSVSYVLNTNPLAIPDDIPEESRQSSVLYQSIPSGTHYFHIRAFTPGGGWGGTSHFSVNIDNVPPAGFQIEVLPGARTAVKNPTINFDTTDANSGVDHYAVKVIPLSSGASANSDDSSFFIEARSPFILPELDFGKYDIVVRAYDLAGNVTEAHQRITISQALFRNAGPEGLNFRSDVILPWWGVYAILFLISGGALYAAHFAYRKHREVEQKLASGILNLVENKVSERLRLLRSKRDEFARRGNGGFGNLKIILIFTFLSAFGFYFLFSVPTASAQQMPLIVSPPLVTLVPKDLGNDDIWYLGGTASVPNAEVIIYLQSSSGETLSFTTKANDRGEWFYSHAGFLREGRYKSWAQLKVEEQFSPPGPEVSFEIIATALRLGSLRISYEKLYLTLALALLAILAGAVVFSLYYFRRYHQKNNLLRKEIGEAEEEVRQGFALLRKDIKDELDLMAKIKKSRELSVEEHRREEKLINDLGFVENHILKEISDIDSAAISA